MDSFAKGTAVRDTSCKETLLILLLGTPPPREQVPWWDIITCAVGHKKTPPTRGFLSSHVKVDTSDKGSLVRKHFL